LIENAESKLDAKTHVIPTLRAALLQEIKRSSGNKFDTTVNKAQFPNIESNLDTTYDCSNTQEPIVEAEVLDATYVQVPSPQKLESQCENKSCDVNYDSMQVNTKMSNATGLRQIRLDLIFA
jgi:hypothetical protein